jgi:hypothetical protein
MRAPAALVTALLLTAAAPAALAFEHKCPALGTEVRTTLLSPKSAPIRYDGQHDLWCLRTLAGKPLNSELGHMAFFPVTQRGSDAAQKYYGIAQELWPLAPGKTAVTMSARVSDGSSAAASDANSLMRTEFRVEPPRSLTVPAGTFTVVPIVYEVIGTGRNYHRGQYTYYYAPDLGTNAKFEYKVVHGSNANPPQSWELVSFKAPGNG